VKASISTTAGTAKFEVLGTISPAAFRPAQDWYGCIVRRPTAGGDDVAFPVSVLAADGSIVAGAALANGDTVFFAAMYPGT
jgi:hypothetical protein